MEGCGRTKERALFSERGKAPTGIAVHSTFCKVEEFLQPVYSESSILGKLPSFEICEGF